MPRTFRFARTLLTIALAATVLSSTAALGAEGASEGDTSKRREITLKPLDAARLAITLGDYKTAAAILEPTLNDDPSSVGALFLMGEINARQKKFAEAIPYYRKIIVDHPNVVRVRLDLARALFETGEDDAAEYNFHLALAEGSLPATVIDNVERYLAIIRSRKRFVYDVNFGVAPDTNLNKATANDHVTLFGLPFVLSQQARQQSGVGVTGTVSGEYRADLQPDLRWRTGALLYGLKYPSNSAFDDAQARGHMGPQWFFGRGDQALVRRARLQHGSRRQARRPVLADQAASLLELFRRAQHVLPDADLSRRLLSRPGQLRRLLHHAQQLRARQRGRRLPIGRLGHLLQLVLQVRPRLSAGIRLRHHGKCRAGSAMDELPGDRPAVRRAPRRPADLREAVSLQAGFHHLRLRPGGELQLHDEPVERVVVEIRPQPVPARLHAAVLAAVARRRSAPAAISSPSSGHRRACRGTWSWSARAARG